MSRLHGIYSNQTIPVPEKKKPPASNFIRTIFVAFTIFEFIYDTNRVDLDVSFIDFPLILMCVGAGRANEKGSFQV
jgi:hypothetical protein